MELTGPDTIALTKAELLAITDIAGNSDGKDANRYVRFRATSTGLSIQSRDGVRALEVEWPLPSEDRFERIEIGVEADFLRSAAKLIQRADAERIALDLQQLARTLNTLTPAKANLVDVETGHDGETKTLEVLSRPEVVIALTPDLPSIRNSIRPIDSAVDLNRWTQLEPLVIAKTLKSLQSGARVYGLRVCCNQGGAFVIEAESSTSGAVWTALVCPLADDWVPPSEQTAEEAPEPPDDEPPARQVTLLPEADPRAAKRTRKPAKGQAARA